MIKHCNNCSKCCEVIAIEDLSHEAFAEKIASGKVSPIHGEMMRPLSRKKALKRNPMIVKGRDELNKKTGGKTFYYTCTKLKDNKCSIYGDRPYMCSGYPFYDRYGVVDETSHSMLSKVQLLRKEPPYSETCTYIPTLIPVKNI